MFSLLCPLYFFGFSQVQYHHQHYEEEEKKTIYIYSHDIIEKRVCRILCL